MAITLSFGNRLGKHLEHLRIAEQRGLLIDQRIHDRVVDRPVAPLQQLGTN
jgi:hypothetical protein